MSRLTVLDDPKAGRWSPRDLALLAIALLLFALATYALTQRDQILALTAPRIQPISLLTTADFHAFAFDPNDANVIYFGHHNGVMQSRNAGVDWTRVLQAGDAMSLATTADAPNTIIAAGHLLLLRSDDRAATWNEIANDLPHTDIHGFAINPQNSRDWFAFVIGNGLFRSQDAGAHWSLVSKGLPDTTMALAVVPGEPLTLYAGTMDQGVLKSMDGGTTWASTNLNLQMAMTLTNDPRDPRVIYAGTEKGLFLFRNSGPTNGAGTRWEQVGLNGKNLMAVALSRTNPQRIIAVDRDGRVYRTDDGGKSW
ncbi:MAG: hypothetical protein HY741_23120 [Chloroflexi bacterium]|nr:hypothetical protein [Chloroflexota bacterium]